VAEVLVVTARLLLRLLELLIQAVVVVVALTKLLA
jgi:hypothetical protein